MNSESCEICRARGVAPGPMPGPAEQYRVADRWVFLCAEHARAACATKVARVEELRSALREPAGQRALLPRRAEERRVFPPRPEGRRMGIGRRRHDPRG